MKRFIISLFSLSLVIPCQWEFAMNFHNGLAEVDDVNGKRHKINKKGEIVK